MRRQADQKVNITTHGDEVAEADRAWARSQFSYSFGESSFRERLAGVREWLGAGVMAEKAGVSESGVKSWLSQKEAEPGFHRMAELSRNSGLSIEYLADGWPITPADCEVEEKRFELAKRAFGVPGTLARRHARQELIDLGRVALERGLAAVSQGAPRAGLSETGASAQAALSEFAPLPRYEVNASAGNGLVAVDESVRDHLAFRRDWLHEMGVSIANAALINAHGDSMQPTIPDGALMLVDRNPDQPVRSGCIYVIVLHGDVLVKRVSRNVVDGTIDLIADNATYPTQTITQADLDGLTIAGRVVWVAHKL